MQEGENVIRILQEAKEAFIASNSYKLKVLSDQTIHAAAIAQDPDNVIVAVLIYSLGKLSERENYKRMEGWEEFFKVVLKNLDIAINSLKKSDLDLFRQSMGNIRGQLNILQGSLADYIRDVFAKAEINKAFRVYEHGLSLGSTAALLGVSIWDLSSYVGQSSISESHFNEAIPIKDRIKLAEEFFK